MHCTTMTDRKRIYNGKLIEKGKTKSGIGRHEAYRLKFLTQGYILHNLKAALN